MGTIKNLWKNENFKTVLLVVLIVLAVFGLWFGSRIVLNTKIVPALAVISESMSIPHYRENDSWLHPFDRTLQVGDIIVIQGVNPKDLKTNYPDSDIIVFHRPDLPSELIVHRIIGVTEVNGVMYFETKGDGNGNPWPQTPQYGLDPWDTNSPPGITSNPPGIPQNLIEGKVVMRIPWIGLIAMKFREAENSNFPIIPIIIFLVILIAIIELVLPFLKKRKNQST